MRAQVNLPKSSYLRKKLRILTNDADVFALQRLRGHKRYIDAGVAEQNLINISAGFSRKNFSKRRGPKN